MEAQLICYTFLGNNMKLEFYFIYILFYYLYYYYYFSETSP